MGMTTDLRLRQLFLLLYVEQGEKRLFLGRRGYYLRDSPYYRPTLRYFSELCVCEVWQFDQPALKSEEISFTIRITYPSNY